MYALFSYLLRPYVVLLLLTGLGLLHLWRKRNGNFPCKAPESSEQQAPGVIGGRKQGRLRWAVVPFVLLLILSCPIVGSLALGSLEWQYPLLEQRPEDAEAVVVLGGGVVVNDEETNRAELDASSLHRCLHALRLYDQTKPCPVLVSGGKPDPEASGPPCAQLMAAFLVRCGVRPGDVLVEDRSRTTYENAAESRKLLDQHHLHRVVLVTEASHLPRAVRCFRKQGLEVVPSPSSYRKMKSKRSLYEFLPALDGMDDCQKAWHEWVGMGWYWLSGKI